MFSKVRTASIHRSGHTAHHTLPRPLTRPDNMQVETKTKTKTNTITKIKTKTKYKNQRVISGLSVGYQRVISGLSVGYQWVIRGLSEGYQWVISGLLVGYQRIIKGLSEGYQRVIRRRCYLHLRWYFCCMVCNIQHHLPHHLRQVVLGTGRELAPPLGDRADIAAALLSSCTSLICICSLLNL